MTRRFLLAAGATAALRAPAVLRASAVLRAADWTPLFDGSSSAGWLAAGGGPFPDSWRIEDGCLHTVQGLAAFQDLRTRGEFLEFEFAFSWRVAPGANSGVKYRLEREERWAKGGGMHARARGAEFQLVDDTLEKPARDRRYASGALYGKIAPAALMARPAGEFNESLLAVRGGMAEHWVNGERVVAYRLEGSPRRSAISLQHHASEVWFRDLRVRVFNHTDARQRYFVSMANTVA